MTRDEVYALIAGERAYQDKIWNADTTASAGIHGIGDYLVFIRHYLASAEAHYSTLPEPAASDAVRHDLRKIAALAVVCMEQNGGLPRVAA